MVRLLWGKCAAMLAAGRRIEEKEVEDGLIITDSKSLTERERVEELESNHQKNKGEPGCKRRRDKSDMDAITYRD